MLDTRHAEDSATIGLLISHETDRRLLTEFLNGLGYQVLAELPPDTKFNEWAKVSLILADERAARVYGRKLLELKEQTGGVFLPILLLLLEKADRKPWLEAGFDEFLRMPFRQADLAAQLKTFLSLRQQSQEQYRELFEHAPIGIFRVGADGQFLMMNPAMLQVIGFASFEEFRSRPFDTSSTAFYAPAHMKELLARAAESGGIEVHWPRRDGATMVADTKVRKLRGADGGVLYYQGTLEDITERKRAEAAVHRAKAELERRVAERTAELRYANEKLRELTHQVVRAQENERRRIALELHDEIGQTLTAVNLNLQFVGDLAPEVARASFAESQRIVQLAIEQVRALSSDLRPAVLDQFGLATALETHFQRHARLAGINLHLHLEPNASDLPPEVETVCFRIAQEALTNIERHAHARNVWVELRCPKRELELVIRDDGIGFDVAQALQAIGHGVGLAGMQERIQLVKGELEFKSSPDIGTEVRVRVPLPAALRGGKVNPQHPRKKIR